MSPSFQLENLLVLDQSHRSPHLASLFRISSRKLFGVEHDAAAFVADVCGDLI